MNIFFFLPFIWNQYFLYMRKHFFVLGCFVKEKNKYRVSASFFENTYTNSKDCSKSRIRIPVPAFLFPRWRIFSSIRYSTCHCRLSERFSGWQAASRTTFSVTGSYRNKFPEACYCRACYCTNFLIDCNRFCKHKLYISKGAKHVCFSTLKAASEFFYECSGLDTAYRN